MSLIPILASVNPPKMAGTNELTFKAAMEACPALAELSSLPPSPFNEGLKTGLGLLFDVFSDTGNLEALSDVSLDRMTQTENKIKKGEMEGILKDLPKLRPFTTAKDAFGAGVFLSFAVLYDMEKSKPTSPEEALKAMTGEEEEVEEEPEEEKTPPKATPKAEANWQLASLLLSLEEKGIDLKTIHLEPVKTGAGTIELHITGVLDPAGTGVSFSDVAKINAIFKTINPMKDIVLCAEDMKPITFKYRV